MSVKQSASACAVCRGTAKQPSSSFLDKPDHTTLQTRTCTQGKDRGVSLIRRMDSAGAGEFERRRQGSKDFQPVGKGGTASALRPQWTAVTP